MKVSPSLIGKIFAAVSLVLSGLMFFGFHSSARGQSPAARATPLATPETFVDALNFAFGKQTKNRATHAKGIVLLGRFAPSAQAPTISSAPHFKSAVPITIRFSANTGIPTISDNADLAGPRGMAIKFHLTDGTETDLVTHSHNGFPTATFDEQQQFFIAVGSSKGTASPTPLEQFLATHPAAREFLTRQDPPPVSYGTIAYYGVNSFKFTSAGGKVTFGRYQVIPEAGRHFLTGDEAAKAAADYLEAEVRSRIAKGPIKFRFVLQLAAPGDKIDDPSVAWADTNKSIELGTIEIKALVPDEQATEQALLFLPALLPKGIEPADPMIPFRSKTYPVSYDRRHP